MVGLHTCGDLAPSTLRMFVAKPELVAVCGVGCCYHLLTEEFDPAQEGKPHMHAHTRFLFLARITSSAGIAAGDPPLPPRTLDAHVHISRLTSHTFRLSVWNLGQVTASRSC